MAGPWVCLCACMGAPACACACACAFFGKLLGNFSFLNFCCNISLNSGNLKIFQKLPKNFQRFPKKTRARARVRLCAFTPFRTQRTPPALPPSFPPALPSHGRCPEWQGDGQRMHGTAGLHPTPAPVLRHRHVLWGVFSRKPWITCRSATETTIPGPLIREPSTSPSQDSGGREPAAATRHLH